MIFMLPCKMFRYVSSTAEVMYTSDSAQNSPEQHVQSINISMCLHDRQAALKVHSKDQSNILIRTPVKKKKKIPLSGFSKAAPGETASAIINAALHLVRGVHNRCCFLHNSSQ